LRVGLLVADAVIEVLGVDDVFTPVEVLQVTDHAVGHDLARRQEANAIYRVPAGRASNYLLQALRVNGVLLVGQLEELDLVDGCVRPGRQLLGDVAAFQPGDDVEAGPADDARHLLDGDVGVPAQVGDVAVVVLVGEDEADLQARGLQRLIRAPLPRLELGGR